MDALNVKILKPRARKILEELAALKLIAISDIEDGKFSKVLKKIHKPDLAKPSLEEITAEVETVRAKRNATKPGKSNS